VNLGNGSPIKAVGQRQKMSVPVFSSGLSSTLRGGFEEI